jgi:hypothetical protein
MLAKAFTHEELGSFRTYKMTANDQRKNQICAWNKWQEIVTQATSVKNLGYHSF